MKLSPKEIVIHGHSLSTDDFDYLAKIISFNNVEKVTYYGRWEKWKADNFNKRLKEIFGENIIIKMINSNKT